MHVVVNIMISAALISFAAWLSGRAPRLAGFIVALPLTTMLVLPLSYLEHRDSQNAILFAKSIFVAIPVTLLFFIPFLLSGRLNLTFWQAYSAACVILPLGYFAHRTIARLL